MNNESKFFVVQILHRILKTFMLRRTKEDRVVKLPPKVEINISVGLTALQMKIYKSILTKMDLSDFTGMKSGFKHALIQLRKVTCHPYMFEGVEDENEDEYGEHLVTNCAKMIFLDKLIDKVRG